MSLPGLGENSDGLAAMADFELHGTSSLSIAEICNIFFFLIYFLKYSPSSYSVHCCLCRWGMKKGLD